MLQDNTFAIEDFYKCEISLNKPLDYKSKSLYSLNITAKVGKAPKRTNIWIKKKRSTLDMWT